METWIRLDNVTLKRTQSVATTGTACLESGVVDAALFVSAVTSPGVVRHDPVSARRVVRLAADADSPAVFRSAAIEIDAAVEPHVMFEWAAPPDAAADLQISADGETWIALATLGSTAQSGPMFVGLGRFAGDQLYVRVVVRDPERAALPAPVLWIIDGRGATSVAGTRRSPASSPQSAPR